MQLQKKKYSFFESRVESTGSNLSHPLNLFSPAKVSPIVRCRAATLADLPILEELADKNTDAIFGTDDVKTNYELSYLTIVAENLSKEIVAGLFLNNYPNLPAVPPSDWISWIRKSFNLSEADPSNTLFVHMAIYNKQYTKIFFETIMLKVFKKNYLIKYVIVIIPPQKKFVDFLPKRKMSIVQPKCFNCTNPQKLIVYLRHDFIDSYKIRRAVVEDNDDLIPLIDTHSRRLRNIYGDYYIAEIISQTSTTRHTIVSEFKGMAVGIIIFNENINLELLENYFQLECFYGLKTPVPEDDEIVQIEQCEEEGRTYYDDLDIISFSYTSSSNSVTLSEKGSCTSTVSSYEPLDMFKGIVEGKFSCNLLHFDAQQLDQWQKSRTETDAHIKYINQDIANLFDKHVYNGPINAFTLELIAAWPEHEKSLLQLLQAGFELFPDKDYCVLCIPSTAPYFQLLTKVFVRVTPLPTSNFPHELYVVHRNSLYCVISIRRAKRIDQDGIEKLLDTVRCGCRVFKTFYKYLTSKNDNCGSYVILANDEIIGMVNVKDLNNTTYILGRYQLSRMTDLTRHRPGTFGRIKHFVLSPIFQRHARFLLLELHRLTDYSLLVHFVEPDQTAPGNQSRCSFRSDPLACVLNELIAVVPAKVPEFSNLAEEKLEFNVPDIMTRSERPFALYMSTPMYCGLSRYEINTKIVVVGASEVGLSFLIELIFNNDPNLHIIFNNVTLVSTHGIPKYRSNTVCDTMLPMSSEKASGYYLSLTSLITFVNVVEGVMTGIDRKAKTITVNSSLLPYDMLFLTCGTQFQPVRKDSSVEQEVTECPANVFVVNTLDDVQFATNRLNSYIRDGYTKEGYFIVYGNCLQAYCCLEALLEIIEEPTEIMFVIPPYRVEQGTLPPFPEKFIEQAILENVASIGVTIYKDYTFCDWCFEKDNVHIKTIMFQTATRTHNINVKAAFMYQKKSISNRTFTAINKANLIFDGALVINPNFETNDPHIFAAGRMTKYPRKYYADHMRHTMFNQGEIGHRMARIVLKKLLPRVVQEEEGDYLFAHCSMVDGKMLVPWYGKPVVVYARVPHKIQYLYVRKPGVSCPMHVARMDCKFGQILTTGDYNNLDTQGYFLLHLNQYNSIETIIALSKKAIERNNLTLLWGKHEALLKNMLTRYKMGLIKDFFVYFSKSWIHALFLDKYEVLEKNIINLLTQSSVEPGLSIIEDIVSKIQQNNINMITSAQYEEMFAKFEDSEYQNELQRMVLDFLTENSTYLPMYVTPSTVTMILGAYEQSPLFTEM